MSRRAGILGPSLLVSAAAFLTGALNYGALLLLASRFGASGRMDAYFAASTIPQVLIAILLAVLANTFIPVFVEARESDAERAWGAASVSFNLLALALGAVTAAANLIPGRLMAWTAPGLPAEASAVAATLFRWLMAAGLFSGISVLLSSASYAQRKFFRPALAQAVNSAIVLFVVAAFGRPLGIRSIAVGTFFGSLVLVALLAPVLFRRGRYRPSLAVRRPEVAKLGGLILPLFLGAVFYRTNPLVERFFASKLGEGRIAYLGYAFRLISALLVVLTQGLSTALLPRMSQSAARGDLGGLKEEVGKGLRGSLILTAPAVLLLAAFGTPVARALYERGRFTAADTSAVALALAAYSGYFLVGSVSLPIVNALYALQKTALVAAVGMSGFAAYVVLAYGLAGPLGFAGISLALSIQYLASLVVFGGALRARLGPFEGLGLGACAGRVLAATSAAAAALWAGFRFLAVFRVPALNALAAVALGGVVYLLVLVMMNTEGLRDRALELFSRRDRE